jgi:uncharacterized protein YggE
MDEARQVRVVGEGSVAATPDRFVLMATLNAMAESAADALTELTQMVSSALRALKDREIPETSLKTQNLLLNDWFDKAQMRVTARVASYELEVTVESVEDLGGAAAALSSEVGDHLQLRGIRPTISDPDPHYNEAQKRAVANARVKAETLAGAAGVALGPILSIEEQRTIGGGPVRAMSTAAFSASSGQVVVPPVPMEPGTLLVRAFVSIVYGIA